VPISNQRQAIRLRAFPFRRQRPPLFTPGRLIKRNSAHIFIARLSTASAASRTASLRVGCGRQVRAISSAAAPNSRMVKGDSGVESIYLWTKDKKGVNREAARVAITRHGLPPAPLQQRCDL
jgi:hypothetical protein